MLRLTPPLPWMEARHEAFKLRSTPHQTQSRRSQRESGSILRTKNEYQWLTGRLTTNKAHKTHWVSESCLIRHVRWWFHYHRLV